MKRIRAVAAICLAVFLAAFLSACGSDGESRLIRYDLVSEPVNLDPPLASDAASSLVVTNLFEGLFRIGADGTPEEAAAESVSVSEDGLEYTFMIRGDAKWSDGSPVTAQDFLFGFQRLFSPETASALSSKYDCIENAEKVRNGEKSLSELGVTAPDEKTLIIRLAYPNASFPVLLAGAGAMPCSRSFFESAKGRYGLSGETLLSNGPYVLKEWAKGSYLALRKNPHYHSADSVKNGGVSLYIQEDAAAVREDLEKGSVHALFAPGDQAEAFQEAGYRVDFTSGSVWGLLLNRSREELKNRNLALALLCDTDRSVFQGHLPSYLTAASAIVPPAVTVSGRNYRDLAAGCRAKEYDPGKAKSYAGKGLSEIGVSSLTSLHLIVPADTPHAELFSYLSQVWQRDLKIYFIVEELESGEYEKRLESGDFDCAVIRMTGEYNSPEAFLSPFCGMQEYGFGSKKLSTLLTDAQKGDLEESASRYAEAEQLILDSAVFLPLYYQTDCFISSPDVTGFIYDLSGRTVDFRECRFRS